MALGWEISFIEAQGHWKGEGKKRSYQEEEAGDRGLEQKEGQEPGVTMGYEIKSHPHWLISPPPCGCGGPWLLGQDPRKLQSCRWGLAGRAFPLFVAQWVNIFGEHIFPGSSQDSCWWETQDPGPRQRFLGTWVGHQGQVLFYLQLGADCSGVSKNSTEV